MTGIRLVVTAELEQADPASLAYGRIFVDGHTLLRPIVVDVEAISVMTDPSRAWESFMQVRLATKEMTPESGDHYRRFAQLESQVRLSKTARLLLEALYEVRAEDFGLSAATTADADATIARVVAQQDRIARELRRYEDGLSQQFTAVGRVLQASAAVGSKRFPSSLREHADVMIQLLVELNAVYGVVIALREQVVLFDGVVAHAPTRQNPTGLNPYKVGLEDKVRMLVARIRGRLSGAIYPFGRPTRETTVAHYLRGSDVTTGDFGAVMNDARTHVCLFLGLYRRTIGEIGLIAEQVERSVH